MQLRGLVAVFAILLIIYSVWLLSFTWFVNKHESKMADRAQAYMDATYPEAKKFSKPADYTDSLKTLYRTRLNEILDSTKEDKITWFGNTYEYSREKELNLGLDLQGGMSVTMEVELTGLIRSMSNNSRDPQFLKALDEANKQKANSDADFISIFYNQFKSIAGDGKMAGIFSAANADQIAANASDTKVLEVIRKEAGQAINRTYQVLRSRIDQFGVAQPNINLDESKAIITVDLPGVDDKERVRKYLQASANLQFWEVYNIGELQNELTSAEKAFSDMMGGTTDTSLNALKAKDTTGKKDTTAKKVNDTNQVLSKILNGQTGTTPTGTATAAPTSGDKRKSLGEYIQFISPYQDQTTGKVSYPAAIGQVKIKDTGTVRRYLNMVANFPADARLHYGIVETDAKTERKNDYVGLYVVKTYGMDKAPIEGDVVTDARQDYEPLTGNPVVLMSMNQKGASDWATLTDKSAKNRIPIAIVLDNTVYSAPVAEQKIEGGDSRITGSFTIQEAQDLASILKVGKLPAPAKIVQEQVVGPTLGAEAIRGGSMAFIISFVVIFLLMLIYYNTSGWIANIALILNILFTVGVLTSFGATLTAPGIAGLVLTIGMAVDTNVIIYERIKEELTRGKSYQLAIADGYRRSLPPVLDAHVTTLLTAIILFVFGLGPVKGFATTQIIGILLSLFCGILVSRWVSDWFTNKKKHLEYFTGISRKIFKHANFKFIEYRKVAYMISFVVLALGVGAIFNGFHQGVEFKGGRSFTVQFDRSKPLDVESVRRDLEVAFQESPTIKTVGLNNQLDITTSYLINDPRSIVDSLVETQLYNGLKNHLSGASYHQFDTQNKLGSKKVLPTISDDLKKGARNATIFSLLIIALYIFIRFRDWRYSLGTIVALLHDVLVTLAAFSFLKNVVPFPLELDQHFIAAILTVIGFSMNDTVIVFDRIREYSGTMKGEPKENIINRAINDTLSRTIMTSLTVFLTILILFIFGGEVTRGFAFAMLIGVITGTYSSIFVAAPLLVDLGRGKALGKTEVVTTANQKSTAKPAIIKS
ncbi:MAG TPA: protein translocase subunit SecDF [Chitinophagaceae bacterium]|nr:protein translocase subunit SecDF [Chitinophagaceae bacterium]